VQTKRWSIGSRGLIERVKILIRNNTAEKQKTMDNRRARFDSACKDSDQKQYSGFVQTKRWIIGTRGLIERVKILIRNNTAEN
jgi:hypothetical protein